MARGSHEGDAATTMTRAECLAAIQTCLHSCLSAVLRARDILPEKAFAREMINFEGADNDEHATEFTLLRPGRSTRANHLLSWLNNGAFGALRRGDLSGLQICIHPDSKRRIRTIETYTFTIQYAPDMEGKLLPTSLRLEQVDDQQTVLVNNIGKHLHKTLQTITALCQSIPELPEERYLSMNLFLLPHADAAPIDGFVKARRESIIWPRHHEWERQTEAFTNLSASLFSTRLKISYMAPSHERRGYQPNMAVLQDFMQAVSVTDDIDWQLAKIATNEQPEHTHQAARAVGHSVTQFSKQGLRNGRSQVQEAEDGRLGPSRRQSQQQMDSQDIETQIAAARMKTALSRMARPEELTQGDTQAASLSLAQPPPAVCPEKVQIEYDYANMYHERADVSVLRDQAAELAKEIGGLTRSGQIILCQCAYSKEEGDMMRCSHCHTWQHTHCYGYVGKDDPRKPGKDDIRKSGEHMCYVCFVDPRDQETLVNMIDLAVSRRAVFRAMRHGIMGKVDFADKLGMDGSIAQPLFEKFKREHYVIAASGSHKAGFKTSGKPPWVPGDADAMAKMLDEYFNPVTNVEQYFKPYDVAPSLLAEKLTIPSATELPAAATPLAIKQKRKRATSTPNSNFGATTAEAVGEMLGSGGKTRRGRIYKPAEQPESESSAEEKLPVAKHARGSATKQDKLVATPAKRKLINMESSRIIDVGASSSGASHNM